MNQVEKDRYTMLGFMHQYADQFETPWLECPVVEDTLMKRIGDLWLYVQPTTFDGKDCFHFTIQLTWDSYQVVTSGSEALLTEDKAKKCAEAVARIMLGKDN